MGYFNPASGVQLTKDILENSNTNIHADSKVQRHINQFFRNPSLSVPREFCDSIQELQGVSPFLRSIAKPGIINSVWQLARQFLPQDEPSKQDFNTSTRTSSQLSKNEIQRSREQLLRKRVQAYPSYQELLQKLYPIQRKRTDQSIEEYLQNIERYGEQLVINMSNSLFPQTTSSYTQSTSALQPYYTR